MEAKHDPGFVAFKGFQGCARHRHRSRSRDIHAHHHPSCALELFSTAHCTLSTTPPALLTYSIPTLFDARRPALAT